MDKPANWPYNVRVVLRVGLSSAPPTRPVLLFQEFGFFGGRGGISLARTHMHTPLSRTDVSVAHGHLCREWTSLAHRHPLSRTDISIAHRDRCPA